MSARGAMSGLASIGGRLYRGEVSFDFVGRRKLWYTISGVILVVSIAALIFRGLNYSVEFSGGEVFNFKTTTSVTQTQVTNAFYAAGSGSDITVERVGSAGWQVVTPVFSTKSPLANQSIEFKIEDSVTRALPLRTPISLESVAPTWGSQILDKALEGLVAFLIVIVLYLSIAFEWRMATAALVALAHDILITVGVYALLGFEVSPATVIGLLTILGYSLYDTVVVFDKVRENTAGLLATRRSTYSDAANLALNQTLVRSINTSLIALLPVASILAVSVTLLGNGELKDLSLVLFVGMLSGTYSSICIATPVLADLKERQSDYRRLAGEVARKTASVKRRAKAAVTVSAQAEPEAIQPAGPAEPDELDGAGAEPIGDAVARAAAMAAGRPVAAGSGSRAASSGPRQQPRRSSSAQRRPSGKKKRR